MRDPVGDIERNRPRTNFDFVSEVVPYLKKRTEKATQGFSDFTQDVQQFISPLKGKFKVTQKFGNVNPSLYQGITRGSKHLGLDLATPTGTEVLAPISGKVQRGTDKNWGNYVDVVAEDGNIYRFSHLSAFDRAIGDMVQAGQVLGRTGSTGNSTGPHLDISVRQGGQFIDPLSLDWLARYLMGGEG